MTSEAYRRKVLSDIKLKLFFSIVFFSVVILFGSLLFFFLGVFGLFLGGIDAKDGGL